jgi:hypothetical protein
MTAPLSPSPTGPWLRPIAWLVVAVGLLAAPAARAEGVEALADRLRNASDFRVRVQAALSLGASGDAAAVKPLCDGLDDSNTAVRSAAAAGLGRLGHKSGLPCLKGKVSSEANASVVSQIKRSITQIETAGRSGGGAARAKPPDDSSKFYVAVGPTKTKGGRSASETDPIVQEAARAALAGNGGFAIAPASETPAQAGGVFARFSKLKGYFLQTTVDEPKYEGSKLTVVVRITMYSYPGKALQGEFAPKLTQSGTPSKDKESEDALIKMAVERAIASFVKVATASDSP